jgi:tetratricopeptide (TPR) repeat protein
MRATAISWGDIRLLGFIAVFFCSAKVFPADSNSASSAKTNPVVRANRIFEESRARYRADTQNPTNAWQFGRAAFDLCDLTTNNATKADIADQGIAACRWAVSLQSNAAPAHYYLGMTIGELADTKRNLAALKMVKEMEREFHVAHDLDERFDFGGPDRNLGLLYRDAPGWPLSIGNRVKARRHLERAVELAPDYPENRLTLIEALVKWGDRDDARTQFKALEKTWAAAKNKFTGEAWAAAWPVWQKRFDTVKQKLGE